MMFVTCSSFLVLFLAPQAAGQGFLRGNASQDVSSILDKAIDAVTANVVPTDDASDAPSESTDAQTYEDMLASSDSASDAEVRSDLKSEANDLQEVLADGKVDAGSDMADGGPKNVVELEEKVDQLEGEANRRSDETVSKWRAEGEADKEDNGINRDIPLAQQSGDDEETDADDDAESDHDSDVENAESNLSDHVASLLQDPEKLYDDHDLIQDASRLEDAMSRRRDEQGKDNEHLQKMVYNLIDETRAAKQARPDSAEPEVIMVLLQKLKKHATIFGSKKAKHTSIWDSDEEEGMSDSDIAEEESLEENADSDRAEEESDAESDEAESDSESDEAESDSESDEAESDAESDDAEEGAENDDEQQSEDDDDGAAEDQGDDSADEEVADAEEEASVDDSADVESEVDVDGEDEEVSETDPEEEVQDDSDDEAAEE